MEWIFRHLYGCSPEKYFFNLIRAGYSPSDAGKDVQKKIDRICLNMKRAKEMYRIWHNKRTKNTKEDGWISADETIPWPWL